MRLKFLFKIKYSGFLIAFLFVIINLQAVTAQTLDKVVGVVGQEIILLSDVRQRVSRMYAEERIKKRDYSAACRVFEDFLFQKILVTQAKLDSLLITEEEVNKELERRLSYFIRSYGLRQQLEEYLGMTIEQFKNIQRQTTKNQMLANRISSEVTGNVEVTPTEVRSFYKGIPKDSLPYISAKYKIAQIVIEPEVLPEEIERVKNELEDIRKDILAGSSFSVKARLYSDDVASAKQGGELGFRKREELDPGFAAAAFSLKEGEVSEVTQSAYGFHIIKMIEKRGELANFRHILKMPQVRTTELVKAENKLDSIRNLVITIDTLYFKDAASIFSEDLETKNNDGLLINPQTLSVMWELSELNTQLFYAVNELKEGQISKPKVYMSADGKRRVRLLYIVEKIPAHVATLDKDYVQISGAALKQKKGTVLDKYVQKKAHKIFVEINAPFDKCNLRLDWEKSSKSIR